MAIYAFLQQANEQFVFGKQPQGPAIYSGTLGYFDVRGGIDTSVVIRTLLVRHGRAHLHVGGGVGADSSAEGEYRESLDKATALLDALERCGAFA